MSRSPLLAGLALGVCLVSGCPGQRRPHPRSPGSSPSPTPSLAPSPGAGAAPSATDAPPQTLPERLAAWTKEVDALLAPDQTLKPADLPRLQALNAQGGLLGEALLAAGQEADYEGVENRLLDLAVVRAQVVDASAEKGR